MRSSIVLTGFLSTVILAHPFHVHHKRDDGAQLTDTYTKDGVFYEEYTKTVVVDANGQPKQQAAPVQTVQAQAPAPKTEEKIAVVDQGASNPAPSPAAQAPASSPAAAPASSPPASSSGGSCSGETIGGNAWPQSACSGGKTIIDQFNEMRAQWNSSLAGSPLAWDDTLAKNAHDTAWASDAENEAETMGHKLFPGSMGQCIAGSFGGTNIFYAAAKMWMCEIKQGPFCDTQTYSAVGEATGHADIIKNTAYTKTGCYFMYKDNDPSTGSGMVTCDFA